MSGCLLGQLGRRLGAASVGVARCQSTLYSVTVHWSNRETLIITLFCSAVAEVFMSSII